MIDAFSLYPDRNLTLEWNSFLPHKIGSKYQREMLLKSCKQFYEAVYLGSRSDKYSPKTLLQRFGKLKNIVRWMIRCDIWRFSDIRSHHLLEFFKKIEPADRERISEKTLKGWLNEWEAIWAYRSAYICPLKIDAHTLESEIRALVLTRPNRPWKGLADEVVYALIGDGLEWIRNVGPIVNRICGEIWIQFKKSVGLTKKQRSVASKRFYDALEEDSEFKAIKARLAFKGPTYKVLSIALSVTEGAVITLLLLLLGQRASELLALDSDCQEWEKMPDGDLLGYVRGIAAKSRGKSRRWVAGDPVPEIVRFMLSLTSNVRASGPTTTRALFLSRHPGAPCFLPGRKSARLSAHVLQKRIEAFACDGLRVGKVQAKKLHPHMARKSFAKLAVKRDRTMLEPVSAHLGHVYREFTDGVYVGIDHELATMLAEEDRRELAQGLEHLLTTDRVMGGAAAALEPFRERAKKFRGRKSLSRLIDELIKKGVTLAPCDWGYCVYSRVYSACQGDETGPNEVNRSAEVCSGCLNFGVTEQHLPWWTERARRESAFLSQDGLPEQTRLFAENRLAKTNVLLKKIISLKAVA
ncbi:hypothetical protein ACSFBX_33110 [Variovorax sp. RB2P76]|uniref:hypothetical protein n=1 Tax=Variovorax sp. RB2P76 TaxID=3443736 RepID=UPI003F447DDA